MPFLGIFVSNFRYCVFAVCCTRMLAYTQHKVRVYMSFGTYSVKILSFNPAALLYTREKVQNLSLYSTLDKIFLVLAHNQHEFDVI